MCACVRIHDVYMHIMYLEPVFVGFQAARKVPSDIGCGQETVGEIEGTNGLVQTL